MAGGRRDGGQYSGRNVSRATMWRRQCLRSQDVAGGRGDRGLYGGGSVKGAGMWLEVGEIEDCMAGIKYQEA